MVLLKWVTNKAELRIGWGMGQIDHPMEWATGEMDHLMGWAVMCRRTRRGLLNRSRITRTAHLSLALLHLNITMALQMGLLNIITGHHRNKKMISLFQKKLERIRVTMTVGRLEETTNNLLFFTN